ncbi:MAG: FAD binding domain-containing protein [Myxococcales bacterium]|nr:FAD binding domain-containing protein [Myxococcales bacterium]MCB9752221.1 FAD binding domain-containing protein [Myxococcales bacterium]
MKPFSLIRPASLDEARAAVTAAPEHVLRAGGVDLIDQMKEGLARPSALVELRTVSDAPALRELARDGDGAWSLGALVTLAQLAAASEFGAELAALREAAGSAATPSIRSMATLGGNLLQRPRCWYYRHAELVCLKKGGSHCLAINGDHRYHAILGGGPSWIVHPSTLASALLALDARVELAGAEARALPIAELFVGPKEDATREHRLAPGEILTRVTIPAAAPGQRSAYEAVKEKQSHDWPLAEVAVNVTVESGTIKAARVALGHVAPIPWRAEAAEAALVGQQPSAALIERAAAAATEGAKPLKRNAYKIPLTRGLVRATLHRALEVASPA